jgi:wobble nucleotide-excising tRNase
MSEFTAREIGQIEAKVDNLDDKIEKLEKHMHSRIKVLENKIDDLSKFMTSINVGIQIIIWIGGASLTVIGFMTKFFGLMK